MIPNRQSAFLFFGYPFIKYLEKFFIKLIVINNKTSMENTLNFIDRFFRILLVSDQPNT